MSSKCGTAMAVELCLRGEAEFGRAGPVWANAAAHKRPQIRNKRIARRIQQSSPEVHSGAFSHASRSNLFEGRTYAFNESLAGAVVVFSLHRYHVLHDLLL